MLDVFENLRDGPGIFHSLSRSAGKGVPLSISQLWAEVYSSTLYDILSGIKCWWMKTYVLLYPSMVHMTAPSATVKLSSQTVPQKLWNNSTLPSDGFDPFTNRTGVALNSVYHLISQSICITVRKGGAARILVYC